MVLCNAEAANQYQDHDSIRHAAEEHVYQITSNGSSEITATAGSLDRRLKLSRCNNDLEAFSPPGRSRGARKTVGVRCTDENPWTLYVPVTLSINKKVAVAAHALPRGHVLSESDIIFDIQDIAALHQNYFTSPKQLIGKKLKRNLKSGDIINAKQLAFEHAVKRGDEITIQAKTNSIQIYMSGKALQNGTIGEQIKVVNNSSGNEVEGTVIEQGIVEVAL